MVHELLGVREVGVRVQSAKVRQRVAVRDGRLGHAEQVRKDVARVRARDAVQRVELELDVGARRVRADGVKVEDARERLFVVVDAIDHVDLELADRLDIERERASVGEIELCP